MGALSRLRDGHYTGRCLITDDCQNRQQTPHPGLNVRCYLVPLYIDADELLLVLESRFCRAMVPVAPYQIVVECILRVLVRRMRLGTVASILMKISRPVLKTMICVILLC